MNKYFLASCWLLIWTASCFDPQYQEGIACSDSQTCPDGFTCDPLANQCRLGVLPNCQDGERNGDETGLDCGGPCEPCADGVECSDGDDCQSGVCAQVCVAPQCDDGVANGAETDVDCGGPACEACAAGQTCEQAQDCLSMVCDDDLAQCVGSGCTDQVQNGDETDIDCGGSECPPCVAGDDCEQGADCASGVCDIGNTDICLTAACDDQVQNGDETDVDCGGPDCPVCPDGDGCELGTDCVSGVCDSGNTDTCLAAACDDQLQNGDETDVDCGGPDCSVCLESEACLVGSDCATGFCIGGSCGYHESCQGILEAGASLGDGSYLIDPDGMGGDPAFAVACDMTTDGGGWTCIEPVVANQAFGMTMTDLEGNGQCFIAGDVPGGQGPNNLSCRFDIDVGFSFDTVRASNLAIEVITASGHVSDLTFTDMPWGNVYGCGPMGDVHFGTPAHTGAVLSLGRFTGVAACGPFVSYPAGTQFDWDGDVATTTEDSVLRLELGESGGENEGWQWIDGCLMVRDETP